MRLIFGLQFLNEITENILKHPNDPKYRQLKITSEKMNKLIMPLKGTVEFLQKVYTLFFDSNP